MGSVGGRRRPLSWQEDRLGHYEAGDCAEIFVEQIRLGYLRIRVAPRGHVSAEEFANMLRRSPNRILPDSVEREGSSHDRDGTSVSDE